MVEWLEGPDFDLHGLGSKRIRALLLCPWERHFLELSPANAGIETPVLKFMTILETLTTHSACTNHDKVGLCSKTNMKGNIKVNAFLSVTIKYD